MNIMQMFGLRFTSASRGTFLHQLSTIIVPFTAFYFGLEPSIGIKILFLSVMLVAGVAMLSFDDVASPFTLHGDGVLLASAFAADSYVIRSKQHESLPHRKNVIAANVIGQCIFSESFLVAVQENGFFRRRFVGGWLFHVPGRRH